MPRTKNKCFKELDFQLLKEGTKYFAYCNICRKKLSNTAASRLQSHRNTCEITRESESSSRSPSPFCTDNAENAGTSGQFVEVIEDYVVENQIGYHDDNSGKIGEQNEATADVSSLQSDSDASNRYFDVFYQTITPSSSSVTPGSNKDTPARTPKRRRHQDSLHRYIDRVNSDEIQEIDSKVAAFFFGCNIPFSTIDSDHFRDMVKVLRPGYISHLPKRKALSTTLLDKENEKCVNMSRTLVDEESVLLIDGWRNTSSNSKTVVTMLQNAKGSQAFLNAWDLTGEAETGDKLAEIVTQSIAEAKVLYNTTVYAVVSDNASTMLKMGRTVPIWHSNCNSHIGNLLAKDIISESITKKVQLILKEFKQPDLEYALVQNGGCRIKLPCDTRWCSYRDSYVCFVNNIHFMKVLIVNDKRCKRVKAEAKQLVFDDDFIEEVRDNIKLLDPICELINVSQRTDSSIADSAHLWCKLQLPQHSVHCEDRVQHRKDMALTIYSLAAYCLHPRYADEAKSLPHKTLEMVQTFLLESLDTEGINGLHSFRQKRGIFQTLFEKNIEDAIVFWNMAKIHHNNLASFALKLVKIPASSAQIERIFSNWSYVHSSTRNRLDFERSKKLLHVYYTYKIIDSNKSDEY